MDVCASSSVPASAKKLPFTQLVQAAPTIPSPRYFPAAHTEHDVLPDDVVDVLPFGQLMQSASVSWFELTGVPESELNFPCEQAAHICIKINWLFITFVPVYVPAAHTVHTVEPMVDERPFSHTSHFFAPVLLASSSFDVGREVPAGQELHVVKSLLAQYEPEGQEIVALVLVCGPQETWEVAGWNSRKRRKRRRNITQWEKGGGCRSLLVWSGRNKDCNDGSTWFCDISDVRC